MPDVPLVLRDELRPRAHARLPGIALSPVRPSRGGGWLSCPCGRNTPTVVPSPGRLSSVIVPPCASTMRSTIASPSPVPLGRVVKNGVFARLLTWDRFLSRIAYRHHRARRVVLRVGRDRHRQRADAAHRLDGVSDQVVEDLAEQARVTPHAGHAGRLLQLDPHLGVRLGEREAPLQEIAQREQLALRRDGPRVAEQIARRRFKRPVSSSMIERSVVRSSGARRSLRRSPATALAMIASGLRTS